jgi:hypothetical protein
LTNLAAERSGSRLTIRFHAADTATKIAGAEVSLNGGEWRTVLPENGLFDSTEADFRVDLEAPAGSGEVVVAVRVADERENHTVAKTVVR